MTLLQGLKKMRRMVEQGKVVKNSSNLYEDKNHKDCSDNIKKAKYGCLLGLYAIIQEHEKYINGLNPFYWSKFSCTTITKKGPEAMLKVIDKQIAIKLKRLKRLSNETMENA